MIKQMLVAACLLLPVAAMAADEKKMTPQQNKMSSCNKEAGEKKLEGDARKAFMRNVYRPNPPPRCRSRTR
jgi:hypothetical protein